jgi:phosphate transport system protein
MTRSVLEHGLHEMTNDMVAMAGMVERALTRAVQAVQSHDRDFATRIAAEDELVNQKRYETERKCLELLATQQPNSRDLRTILAVLMIIVDLERMGDYAAGIANVLLRTDDLLIETPYATIQEMADVATSMLGSSLEAFMSRDVAQARAVAAQDDKVDALCERVYADLLRYMTEHPAAIAQGTHFMWIARYLERTADRVLNICERVIYVVQGETEELNNPA